MDYDIGFFVCLKFCNRKKIFDFVKVKIFFVIRFYGIYLNLMYLFLNICKFQKLYKLKKINIGVLSEFICQEIYCFKNL